MDPELYVPPLPGTRGAHVSISSISGIATKTSFAMFLLHSIINCGVLAGEAHNTKILIFSVKGEDLLFLDYANSRLTPEQTQRYEALNLPAAPFKNVRVFAPLSARVRVRVRTRTERK